MKYDFETILQVRDYECDIEGIVNNANYLHYAEHTRHLFLKERGLSFAEMHRKGVDAVVARMNLQYKAPLRCDDEFRSCLSVTKEGIKYVFTRISTGWLTTNSRSEPTSNWCVSSTAVSLTTRNTTVPFSINSMPPTMPYE